MQWPCRWGEEKRVWKSFYVHTKESETGVLRRPGHPPPPTNCSTVTFPHLSRSNCLAESRPVAPPATPSVALGLCLRLRVKSTKSLGVLNSQRWSVSHVARNLTMAKSKRNDPMKEDSHPVGRPRHTYDRSEKS